MHGTAIKIAYLDAIEEIEKTILFGDRRLNGRYMADATGIMSSM